MGGGAHGVDGRVIAGAAIQFVGEVEVQSEASREIGGCSVDLACGRYAAIGTVALDPDIVVAVQAGTGETEIGVIGGGIGGGIIPAHDFVPPQRLPPGPSVSATA